MRQTYFVAMAVLVVALGAAACGKKTPPVARPVPPPVTTAGGTPAPNRPPAPPDTQAPAVPSGLTATAGELRVSLAWTANSEPDLAGYIVIRAIEPATELTPVTLTPIQDTNFRDTVPTGSRATYAVLAVDKAGNHSAPSNQIAETAR